MGFDQIQENLWNRLIGHVIEHLVEPTIQPEIERRPRLRSRLVSRALHLLKLLHIRSLTVSCPEFIPPKA